MSNNDDFFGGFADIAGEISPHISGGPMDLGDDGIVTDTGSKGVMSVDPEELTKEDEAKEEKEETTKTPTDTGDEEGAHEEEEEESELEDENENEEEEEESDEIGEDEEEDEEKGSKKSEKRKKEEKAKEPVDEGDEEEDLSKVEADISQYFTEKLASALGVDIGDDEKFEKAEDVVDFMVELLEESSVPEFANEDIQKLNQFVEDGGDIKDYFKQSFGEFDLDSADLSSESTQKAVIGELLKTEGYSEERIKRRIERYEEAGTLEEEAEDAKELLSEYREKNSKKLLEEQQNLAEEHRKQQQKVISNVQSNIKALKNVRGIPVSENEKRQLLDYIFTPDSDGLTQYQKDYAKDVNNLIESAYFTMKGDALINKIQNKANSNAVRNIKTKLESKGKRGKSARGQGERVSDLDVFSKASKFLSKR